LWIEDAALECWQTLGPSGQARYTGAAIQTRLMLLAASKLALRQIEGLMTSVLSFMGWSDGAQLRRVQSGLLRITVVPIRGHPGWRDAIRGHAPELPPNRHAMTTLAFTRSASD
jgi:hypothetical protein